MNRPRITTRQSDSYHPDHGPYQSCTPECHRSYAVLADGQPTYFAIRRLGTDLPELVGGPDGNHEEYLAAADLRGGLPEGRRRVAELLAAAAPSNLSGLGGTPRGQATARTWETAR